MKINGIDYKIAPCALCGESKFFYTPKESYDEVFKEKNKAAISFECFDCHVEVWEMNNEISDYDEKMATLIAKWNRLCGGKDYADKED